MQHLVREVIISIATWDLVVNGDALTRLCEPPLSHMLFDNAVNIKLAVKEVEPKNSHTEFLEGIVLENRAKMLAQVMQRAMKLAPAAHSIEIDWAGMSFDDDTPSNTTFGFKQLSSITYHSVTGNFPVNPLVATKHQEYVFGALKAAGSLVSAEVTFSAIYLQQSTLLRQITQDPSTFANIQSLCIPQLALNLTGFLTLLKALPYLTCLSCSVWNIAPSVNGVHSSSLPAYVAKNYAMLNRHFNTLDFGASGLALMV
ncbi:hypothetical protein GGI07_004179 [Coemansia sp. Benny D115]|nr:hypothetical protein GGI07_004179 [Coemansia sp. Benny D115]